MRGFRLAPLSGILAIIVLVIGFGVVGGETPSIEDSPQKIVSFYADESGEQRAAVLLVALASLFLTIFVASLRARLHAIEGPNARWSALAFAGGIIAAAGFLLAATIHLALTEAADKNVTPEAVQALNALDYDSFIPAAGGLGMLLLGSGAAIVAGTGLPRWLGWVALLIGIVAFTPIGFAAFLASGIWIVVMAVLLYRAGPPGELQAADPGSGSAVEQRP